MGDENGDENDKTNDLGSIRDQSADRGSRFPGIPFAPSRCPFFYGWVVLFAGTLGVIVSAPSQTIGVAAFVEPLMADTGLGRATTSFAYGVGTMISALLLTYGGRFYDRFGARQSAALAALVMGLTLIALSYLETMVARVSGVAHHLSPSTVVIAFLVPAFLLLRFSGQGMLTMVSRNMVMKWFVHRRGLANGIMGVFIGLSFSVSPRVFNSMIDRFSWQVAWRMMGILSAVFFVVLVLIFYRDNPSACGLQPDGKISGHPGNPRPAPEHDFRLGEAVRTWAFWIFTMALSIQALYGTAFAFHIESIMAHVGFDIQTAYGVFFPSAVISVAVGLAAGWISDHVRLNRLLACQLAGMALSICGLLIHSQRFTFGLIVIGNGLSSAMFGVLLGVTWPRYFGRLHLGEISGFHLTINVLFSAIGPAFFALSLRYTDGYRAALWCCLIAIAVLVALIPKAVRPVWRTPRQLLRVVVCGLVVSTAHPGSIRLGIDSHAAVTNASLHVRFELNNVGPSDAHRISIEDRDAATPETAELETLAPGERTFLHIVRPLPERLADGLDAARFYLRYHDQAGGRASLGLAVPYSIGTGITNNPPLVLALETSPLRRRGEIRVIGAATTGVPVTITLLPCLPAEIEAPERLHWTVHPGGSLLRIPIHNRNARPGSRYPIRVIARTETAAGPHAVLAGAWLDVVAPRGAALWTPGLLAASLILLICAAIPFRGRRS